MPAKFDKLGIAFQYPDNWQLDDDDALEGRKSVTVYTPDRGAFWTVSIHPRSADPARLAAAALAAMKQEYEEVEAEAVQENVSNVDLVGYDLNFYYLDLINTAAVRCWRTDRAAYTIFYQAEDREFNRFHAVFQAMTTSLLRGLK